MRRMTAEASNSGGVTMLFAAIGEEWARAQRIGPGERHAMAERLVHSAPPSSIAEQWAKYVQEHSMELSGCWPDLLDLARTRILDGEDVERVGRMLVAIGHLTPEGQAAGHFLVGHTHRFLDEGARHLGLARTAYLDVGQPAIAALAGVAAEAASLVGAERMIEEDANLDALGQAVDVLVAADSACAARLRPALGRFASILHLTHDLMAGGQLPTEPFSVTEDELNLLRIAMVAALRRPERTVAIARWTQSALGLPADSTVEFDVMVELLSSVHDWEPRLVLLRDMIDHGDRRHKTVVELARTLIELGRSNEAKAALEARIGARPGPEHIDLLRFRVMLGQAERDPDTPRWMDALLAVGGDVESMIPPPTQAAETDGGARKQLMAHFDPVEGRLTLDPRIPPGEIAAHMNAALIVGHGPEEGAEILRTLANAEPDLYRQVLDLLPVEARIAPTAAERMRAGEELFRQKPHVRFLQSLAQRCLENRGATKRDARSTRAG